VQSGRKFPLPSPAACPHTCFQYNTQKQSSFHSKAFGPVLQLCKHWHRPDFSFFKTWTPCVSKIVPKFQTSQLLRNWSP
jgi:hypothetical protein